MRRLTFSTEARIFGGKAKLKRKHLEENKTHDELIGITLDLIDKKGSSKNVNLREIAKLYGCAHTNIYNYFDNYEDLLWSAMERVLDRMVKNTESWVEPERIEEEGYLSKFVEAHIDFGINHPGWYHFIWLDQFKKTASSKKTIKVLEKLEARFYEIVYAAADRRLSRKEASEAGVVIHGYLHGEICKLIAKRYLNISEKAYRERIKVNVNKLIESFVNFG